MKLSMDKVSMRNIYLQDTREGTLLDGKYDRAINSFSKKSNNILKESVNIYLSGCTNVDNASHEYKRCIKLLEQLELSKNSKLLNDSISFVNTNIVPYTKNVKDLLSEVKKSKLSDDNKSRILVEVADYILADRILSNHNKLSKRFKLNEYSYYKNKSFDTICENVCRLIDTYDMKPSVKIELALEEVNYLNHKFKFPNYDESIMIESVSDYFLSTPNFNLTAIRNILQESRMISNLNRIDYLFNKNIVLEDSDNSDDEIKDLINRYKTEQEKNDTKFKSVMKKIFAKRPEDIIEDFPDIFKWIRNFGILYLVGFNSVIGIVAILANWIGSHTFTKDEVNSLYKFLKKEKKEVEKKIADTDNSEDKKKLEKYSAELDRIIKNVETKKNDLASFHDDADDYDYDEEDGESSSDSDDDDDDFDFDDISLESSKLSSYKVNTLINDSVEAGKAIDKKVKKDIKNAEDTDIKDELTESNILSYVTEKGYINSVLCTYDISKINNKSDIHKKALSIKSKINESMTKSNGKLFIYMNESELTFGFRSKFKVLLSLKESLLLEDTIVKSDRIRINKLLEMDKELEDSTKDVNDKLPEYDAVTEAILQPSFIHNLSKNEMSRIIDLWSIGLPLNEKYLNHIVKEYVEYNEKNGNYIDTYNISSKYRSFSINENTPLSIKFEALSLLKEEVETKKDNNKFDGKKMLNKAKKTIGKFKDDMSDKFNNLMDKAKENIVKLKDEKEDIAAKGKEILRDLDGNAEKFKQEVKETISPSTSVDNIMKGQINGTFSKMMKQCYVLAGIGIATGGIVGPIIATLGGLAASKNIAKKERKKLLDQIDIELKLIDKDIKQAEDDDDKSKLRNLMYMQRNLQRERQNIIFRLKSEGISVPKTSFANDKGDD